MVFFFRMKKGLKIALIAIGAIVLVLGITIAVLVKNANRIIKYELESLLGEDFSVERIDLHWGRVEALDVSLRNPTGKEVFTTDSLTLEADFIGLLKKKYIISNLSLKNPYILLEKDRKGNLINPLPSRGPKRGTAEKEKSIPPVVLKKIEIKKGSLDYLDRKASRKPVLTKLRNIEVECKDITYPLNDTYSTYKTTASIPGKLSTGILKSQGKIKPKTKDTDSRVEIRKLDITGFKPYFQKRGDVNVTRGTLDMDIDVKVKSNKIHAPGKAVLRDLEFERRPGIANKFLNIPLSAVMKFLKNNNNEIAVNFVLEGDLDNPKFSLRENFTEKVSVAMAEKLGLPIKEIGESIIKFGAEGDKEIEKGIEKDVEGIGEELFKILDR